MRGEYLDGPGPMRELHSDLTGPVTAPELLLSTAGETQPQTGPVLQLAGVVLLVELPDVLPQGETLEGGLGHGPGCLVPHSEDPDQGPRLVLYLAPQVTVVGQLAPAEVRDEISVQVGVRTLTSQ